MARDGFFTGLDIGTSSIKVLVAEFVNGSMNVIGVSNVPSSGVKDGIIVDIEAASQAIRLGIEQAGEKAGLTIDTVSVGLPANLLRIEPTQGMIPVNSESKEIKDEDVESVIKSALTKNVAPEREVISLVPQEFVVDGFQGIRDPRGMMGVRLEMRGLIYTGPTTILHNLRKTVEKAGLKVGHVVISPLSLSASVLNEGEREFGATVLDLGGGQTTVAVTRAQELHYTNVYAEGGDYVTKDISKVLQISLNDAETLKYNFGSADVAAASLTDAVQVEVVGGNQPIDVTERYLAEIIAARIRHILERVKQDLDRGRLLDLPGGVVLTGGGAILPGVTELAEEVFGTNVRLFVPGQVGIRNPMFANVIGLVEYVGQMSDVDVIAQAAVSGDELLRRKPVAQPAPVYAPIQPAPVVPEMELPLEEELLEPVSFQEPEVSQPKEPKKNVGERMRGLFGSLFD